MPKHWYKVVLENSEGQRVFTYLSVSIETEKSYLIIIFQVSLYLGFLCLHHQVKNQSWEPTQVRMGIRQAGYPTPSWPPASGLDSVQFQHLHWWPYSSPRGTRPCSGLLPLPQHFPGDVHGLRSKKLKAWWNSVPTGSIFSPSTSMLAVHLQDRNQVVIFPTFSQDGRYNLLWCHLSYPSLAPPILPTQLLSVASLSILLHNVFKTCPFLPQSAWQCSALVSHCSSSHQRHCHWLAPPDLQAHAVSQFSPALPKSESPSNLCFQPASQVNLMQPAHSQELQMGSSLYTATNYTSICTLRFSPWGCRRTLVGPGHFCLHVLIPLFKHIINFFCCIGIKMNSLLLYSFVLFWFLKEIKVKTFLRDLKWWRSLGTMTVE